MDEGEVGHPPAALRNGQAHVSGDWIETFLDYTAPIPSAELFRLWGAIGAVGAAMERRTFSRLAGGEIYSNLFLLLVGAPASGKTLAILHVRELVKQSKQFYLAAKGITKAALLDAIAKSQRAIKVSDVDVLQYHSLFAATPEFGVLLPAHDTEFLNVLNDIFDNPPDYRDETRTSKSVDIANPQINILGGTQPSYLAGLLPEEAWGMGFMSRVIMIYASKAPKMADLFAVPQLDLGQKKFLVAGLTDLARLRGAFGWHQAAVVELNRWYTSGMDPVPEHSKLEYYLGRRLLTVVKLAMISSASRGTGEMIVELADLTRAKDWLFAAEVMMPDVFREMVLRSDSQTIQELHFFAWKIWVKEKKPIHEGRLIHFLSNRVSSERIEKVLGVAEKAGFFSRDAGTQLYRPRPKHEHGME